MVVSSASPYNQLGGISPPNGSREGEFRINRRELPLAGAQPAGHGRLRDAIDAPTENIATRALMATSPTPFITALVLVLGVAMSLGALAQWVGLTS